MTMPIQVRPASIFDSAILEKLHRLSSDADWDEPWSEKSFGGILATPGAIGLLAVSDGAPVGFALGRIAADESEVLLIATHPEHRRRGVARSLLSDLLQRLGRAGARRVFLEVAAPNAAALALYRSAGFDAIGRRPNYYPLPADRPGAPAIDAVLLGRDL